MKERFYKILIVSLLLLTTCIPLKMIYAGMSGNGFSGTESDPVAGGINGIVKGDGAGNLTAATAGTNYQAPITVANPIKKSLANQLLIYQATDAVDGYLDHTDRAAFNGKQAALNGTGFVKMTGTTPSYDNTIYQPTITVAAPILKSVANQLLIYQASGSVDGYLAQGDWTTFNGKQDIITVSNTTMIETIKDGVEIYSNFIGTLDDISNGSTYGKATLEQISDWGAAYSWGDHAGLYLDINGKADDADTLDSHDSTYFQEALSVSDTATIDMIMDGAEIYANGINNKDVVTTAPLTINAGANLDNILPGADADVTLAISDATTTTKGVASFDTNFFSVAAGAVTPATNTYGQDCKNLYINGLNGGTFVVTYDALQVGAYNLTSGSFTVDVDGGTGVLKLDTGSYADATWYYIWVICKANGGVPSAFISLSATAPTLPADYLYQRRVGSLRSISTSAYRKFITGGYGLFYYETFIAALTNGTQTSATDVSCTTIIPPTSNLMKTSSVRTYDADSPSAACSIRANGTTTQMAVGLWVNGAGYSNTFVKSNPDIITDTSQIFEYWQEADDSYVDIDIAGYLDNL